MNDFVSVIDFFLSKMNSLFNLLNSIRFEYGGFTIYYGWLIIAILIIYMACAVFWKGARA